ncbi:hypothetical protein ACWKSP_09995 [Micromonosporaceae bacterium Da 78-11]
MPADQPGEAPKITYNFTDLSQIEADVAAMESFAKALAANVESNYKPNMREVSASMLTEIPPVPAGFVELHAFLLAHREAQDVTQQNVYGYGNGTSRFANAAAEISSDYEGSDAFSHAKVGDVTKAFDSVGIPDSNGSSSLPRQNTEGDL